MSTKYKNKSEIMRTRCFDSLSCEFLANTPETLLPLPCNPPSRMQTSPYSIRSLFDELEGIAQSEEVLPRESHE